MLTSGPQKTIWGVLGWKDPWEVPSPTSFLLRAALLASTGSDQPTQISCAFISQGHSSILPGERGMHWEVTHIHHVQAVRCFPEVRQVKS